MSWIWGHHWGNAVKQKSLRGRKNVKKRVVMKDLVADLVTKKGLTKAAADRQIRDVLDLITAHLVEGRDVKVTDFFNFYVKSREEKLIHNPATNQPTLIPERRIVQTRMTKPLKDRLQDNK